MDPFYGQWQIVAIASWLNRGERGIHSFVGGDLRCLKLGSVLDDFSGVVSIFFILAEELKIEFLWHYRVERTVCFKVFVFMLCTLWFSHVASQPPTWFGDCDPSLYHLGTLSACYTRFYKGMDTCKAIHQELLITITRVPPLSHQITFICILIHLHFTWTGVAKVFWLVWLHKAWKGMIVGESGGLLPQENFLNLHALRSLLVASETILQDMFSAAILVLYSCIQLRERWTLMLNSPVGTIYE